MTSVGVISDRTGQMVACDARLQHIPTQFPTPERCKRQVLDGGVNLQTVGPHPYPRLALRSGVPEKEGASEYLGLS